MNEVTRSGHQSDWGFPSPLLGKPRWKASEGCGWGVLNRLFNGLKTRNSWLLCRKRNRRHKDIYSRGFQCVCLASCFLLVVSGAGTALIHRLHGFLPIDLIFVSLLLVTFIYLGFRLKSATCWLMLLSARSFFFIRLYYKCVSPGSHRYYLSNKRKI